MGGIKRGKEGYALSDVDHDESRNAMESGTREVHGDTISTWLHK